MQRQYFKSEMSNNLFFVTAKMNYLKWKWSSLWSEKQMFFLVFGQTFDEKTKFQDPFLILKKTKHKRHKHLGKKETLHEIT